MLEEIKDKNLNAELEILASDLGATALGFSDLQRLPKEKNKGYDSGITVLVRLSKGVLNEMKGAPTQTYFSHYRTLNRLIDMITLRLVLFLEEKGYPSLAIPASQSLQDASDPYTGAFQHKTGAVLSGLGFIGRSALFIHKEYGPSIRMGTVLTNAPLLKNKAIMKSQCGECRACVKACPAMAIDGTLWEFKMERNRLYDAHTCSEHMKMAYKNIGRGAVCGLCVVACPVGK